MQKGRTDYCNGRFTKAHIFPHYESAKSYYVSATAIVIKLKHTAGQCENCRSGVKINSETIKERVVLYIKTINFATITEIKMAIYVLNVL